MKAKHISILEKQIMDIIWKKQKCSVREVVSELTKKKTIAYTTVSTIFQRLYEKGYVVRKEHQKGFIYSPKISKKIYTKQTIGNFLRNYIQSFGDLAITSFAESIEDLPKEKRESLIKLLTQNENNK